MLEYILEYLSKSWFLFEKIREDSIITLQELEEFRKLMENYEKALSIKDNSNEFIKLQESLKKEVEKEAMKEVKLDLKNEMKNEIKQKYIQK